MRHSVALLLVVSAILAPLALPSGEPAPARDPDHTADSLFDASAFDSLLAFSEREVVRARADGDTVRFGRMVYQRARARLILRLPQGDEDLEASLALARAHRDTLGLVNALGVKSYLLVGRGQWEESLRLNAERIPLARAIGNRRNEGWGHLLVAYVHLLREDLPTARAEYEEALVDFRAARRPQQELTATIGLARVLERQGEFDQCRATYQRALPLAQGLKDDTQEADIWNNLAELEYEQGDLAVAAEYFRRAYELKRDAGAPDLSDVAGNVALVDAMLGRYAAAESVLVDAIDSALRWNYTNGVVRTQIDLGDMRLIQRRYSGAAACYRRALTLTEPSAVRSRSEAASGLARALSGQDSLGLAIAVLDRGLSGLSSVAPSSWRAECFIVWARCLRRGGDIPRAGKTARLAWDDAASRSDTTFAILAAVELSECLDAEGELGLAHRWFSRARAMYSSGTSRASEFQWREAQRLSLSEPLVAQSDVLLEWPPDVPRRERERALFDCLQEIKSRTLLERIADPRRAPDFDAGFSRPATAEELQRDVLLPGECLLDVTIANDELFVFALASDAMRLVRVSGAAQLQKQASRYYRLLAQAPASDDAGDLGGASRSLGQSLLNGVSDIVTASTRVYVSLDGWLSALPLETLVCPNDGDVPLIERRDLVRVPSATLLRLQRVRRAPVGSGPASVLAVASSARELQGSRREVNRLAGRYRHVERLDDGDREKFLLAIAAPDAVHVATHVRVDAERPWYSSIEIGDKDPAPAEAGVANESAGRALGALTSRPGNEVRAHQIASARTGARLVVLSGCESALGRATQGEGVLGLAAAFFVSGARAVVASIWEVDDRATADLMERLYAHLADGEPVAHALRMAQLDLRAERSHPFFWAGFVVIGDGDVSIRLEERGASHRYWVLLAALIVVAIIGWVVTRGRGTAPAG
jgi:CHAT domain-containing protein/Tfp pilus assembly protein PilF